MMESLLTNAQYKILQKLVINLYTVNPALVTTCLQRPHFFVSLENGFSLNHVLNNMSTKTTCQQGPLFVFPLGGRYRQVWL